MRPFLASLPALVLCLSSGACAGRIDNPERFLDAGSCDAEAQVFATRCASCHAATGSAPDLVTAGIRSRIAGGTSSCNGQSMALHLWQKVQGTQPSSCGAAMPQGGTLSATELDCVRSYLSPLLDGGL